MRSPPTLDPGDQEHGKARRKPRPAAPAPAQRDIFDPGPWKDLPRPSGPSEGEERKEKAIEKHENSSRAPLLRFLRNRLRALSYSRAHSDHPFVTADDAVKILKESQVVPHTEDGEEEPRNWLGALFKEPGWRMTGSVPSLRPELNGRHVRKWQWQG